MVHIRKQICKNNNEPYKTNDTLGVPTLLQRGGKAIFLHY